MSQRVRQGVLATAKATQSSEMKLDLRKIREGTSSVDKHKTSLRDSSKKLTVYRGKVAIPPLKECFETNP